MAGDPPDRAAEFEGFDLGPTPAAQEPPPLPEEPLAEAAPEQVAEPVVEKTPAAAAPAPRRARAARPKTTSDEPTSDEPKGRTVFGRIPASMFAQVNLARAESGDTHEQWFLRGLNAVSAEVQEHYLGSGDQEEQLVPVPQRRARQPSSEALTGYPLRLGAEAVGVLEDLQKKYRPVSEAEFVTTVVRLRLAQLARAKQAQPDEQPIS